MSKRYCNIAVGINAVIWLFCDFSQLFCEQIWGGKIVYEK